MLYCQKDENPPYKAALQSIKIPQATPPTATAQTSTSTFVSNYLVSNSSGGKPYAVACSASTDCTPVT